MSLRQIGSRVAILAVAIALGAVAAQGAEIRCGDTVGGELASGPAELAFAAAPGEVVSATVVPDPVQPGFAPTWRIADVEGRPVLLADGTRSCTGRCETAPLPGGSPFSLRIADPGSGAGTWVASLEAVSATADGVSNGPPTPTCARTVGGVPDGTRVLALGDDVAGAVDRAGETDTFTWLGAAGDVYAVSLARAGGDDAFAPAWAAYDASGAPIGRSPSSETASLTRDGVVTILVADAALRAAGTYGLRVTVAPAASSTTTTTLAGSSTTSTSEPGASTTTTTGGATTTSLPGATTSSTATPASTTTSSLVEPGSTTTSVPGGSTTTATAPPSTTSTTTPPPVFDLGHVLVAPPVAGPRSGLGQALAVVDGRLLVGAPHETVGRGRDLVSDAGAVLVVDVTGAPGTPAFGGVVRMTRPDGATAGDRFGAALATGPGGVVVGAPGAGAAFVFASVADTVGLRVAPPAGADGAGFGAAVAVANDVVVVGAPDAGGGAGVAFLFDRATGAPRGTLAPPGPAGRFGAAMAASGSLVAIGAPGGGAAPGRAFVFDVSTGSLVTAVAPQAPVAGDRFGTALAFTGDGALAVGAPGADGARGRVDVFDPGSASPSRSVAPADAGPGAALGAAVTATGGTLVAGAPGAVRDGVAGGAAWVVDVATGVVGEVLQKPMPQADDAFGAAVAAVGGRLFVGAPGDDAGTVEGGVVYVFDAGAVVAALRQRLSPEAFGAAAAAGQAALYVGAPEGAGGVGYVVRLAPDGGPGDTIGSPDPRHTRFGASVAVLGATVVVGAPETPGAAGERVGAVHLFDGSQLRATLHQPDPAAGDEFGFAVGTLGDDVLASAPFAGDGDTGVVYRFDPAGRPRVTYAKPIPIAGDFFGAAIAGDAGQVLVGTPLDASGGAPTGAAYLFDADTSSIVHALPNPTGVQDLFGAAVALGDWIVVGAPLAQDGLGIVGTVWIFDRATGALVRRLQNPRSGTYDHFGAAVALTGDRLVVGAPLSDDRGADAGLAYLFDAASGQLLQTFRDPPQGAFDNFGFSVAATASGVLVGSPGSSRAYVFEQAAVSAPLARAVATAAAGAPLATPAVCGNGLVEAGEACDDGNTVDTDDCRNDCTPGPCCAIDAPVGRCDDGDPCTTDILDPVVGCRYESSGAPGCCQADADCAAGETCRVCVGCFVYHWDCCDTGSRCVSDDPVVVNPECVGKSCADAAYCQCAGKLDCGDETIPPALRTTFGVACDILRLQRSVAPDGTLTRPEVVLARQQARRARSVLRRTVRAARIFARGGQISRACRKRITDEVRVVRRAIPHGKQLRRCLVAGG